MIGEVLRFDGEWVEVLVRSCTVVSEEAGCKVLRLPPNEELRRKRRTIEKGRPERLV